MNNESVQDIQSRRKGMVIIKPLKVLVCLAILSTLTFGAAVWAYNGTDISGGTGLQGEALSADPRVRSGPPQQVPDDSPILAQ